MIKRLPDRGGLKSRDADIYEMGIEATVTGGFAFSTGFGLMLETIANVTRISCPDLSQPLNAFCLGNYLHFDKSNSGVYIESGQPALNGTLHILIHIHFS